MAKYFKRIGTKKIIYEYEIQIEKIEIKLPQPCQLSVLMKRGYIFSFIILKTFIKAIERRKLKEN